MKALKNTFLAIFLTCLAFESFAMDFYPGTRDGNETSNKNPVWSTTVWGNSHDFDTMIPKSMKPGIYDTVRLRHYAQNLNIDTDINVGNLELGFWSKVTAVKRNIKVKWWIRQPSVINSVFRMEGGSLEVGRMWEFWCTDAGGCDWAKVELIDVNPAVVKGDLVSVFHSANIAFKNSSPRGVTINLEGKTKFEIAGVILDNWYKTKPQELVFKFIFTEKDGQVPSLYVSKLSDLTECIFEVVLTSKVRPGRYPIIENNNRRSPADYKKFFVNGKSYNIGDSITIGERSIKLVYDGKDRNSQEKNCVFLEVK